MFTKHDRPGAHSSNGDLYHYNYISPTFRKQFILLCERVIGKPDYHESNLQGKFYTEVCRILREEYGVFDLSETLDFGTHPRPRHRSSFPELTEFIVEVPDVTRCLKAIELVAQKFTKMGRNEAITTLNQRLQDARIGYQFENGQMLRLADHFLHAEVIRPTLSFLRSPGFEGANQEFLQAHEKYRQGDYKGSLVESAKAFESVLKIILRKHGQNITERDTASVLLTNFFGLNLLPSYLEKQITNLKSLLQGGAPNVRNKEAAHGQGEEIREVPEYLAAYGLHQTASAILLIVKAHEAAR